MSPPQRIVKFFKFLRRWLWISPAKHWDWLAAEMREECFSEAEITAALGPRPDDDA